MVGKILGQYQLLRLLGEGGMGAVYEAVHTQIDRRVAIKVLHAEYARQRETAQRFFNEARAVNVVAHPSVVQISECGETADGSVFLVMEYLDGETLSRRLMKYGGQLSEPTAARLIWQLASGLAAAHERGIVHRDLKPSNIMLAKDPAVPGGERVKLLDFGVAKLGPDVSKRDPARTRTGLLLGTPLYMAPEQCRGSSAVDGKADVYSLGVLFYELLAGRPPFVADTDFEVLGLHVNHPPPPLRKYVKGVSKPVTDLVMRMLSKNAADRPTAHMVVTELEPQIHQGGPIVEETSVHASNAADTMVVKSGSRSKLKLKRRFDKFRTLVQEQPILIAVVLVALAMAALVVASRRPSSSYPPVPPVEAQSPPKPSPPTPPARRVHLALTTSPPGVFVIRIGDGQVLGTTPWNAEYPMQHNQLPLLLRKEGYRERALTLPCDQDAARHETLEPNQPPPPPPPQVTPPPPPPPRTNDSRGNKHNNKRPSNDNNKQHPGKPGGRPVIVD